MKNTIIKRIASLGAATALAGAGLAATAGLGISAAGAATTTTVNLAFSVPVFGGFGTQQVTIDATAPATVVQGAAFSETITPAATTVPSTDSVGTITATVGSIQGIVSIVPLPANASPGTNPVVVNGTGTDTPTSGPATTFTLTATLCTTATQTGCTADTGTAQGNTSGWLTTLPYVELSTGSTTFPAGSTVQFPGVTTNLIASGAVGSTIQPELTEFQTTANVTSPLTLSSTIYGWPVASSYTGGASGTTAPADVLTPLATTTIVAPTVVPTGAIGGLSVAVLAGAGLVFIQRRRMAARASSL